MAKKLFSERHGQGKPRTAETVDEQSKTGLLGLLSAVFGQSFPLRCPDGTANAGCDTHSLRTMVAGYGLVWPQGVGPNDVADMQMFDLLEFSYEHVASPQQGGWHDYHRHHHFDYDQGQGRARREGEVVRLVPAAVEAALATAIFNTGDAAL